MKTGTAEVNGTSLYYEMAGKGKPIVFIHGNFGDRRHWDFQFEPLSQQYKVARYDVQGYGKSGIPKPDETYRDCDDLNALLDYLEIDKAHICGLSMGSCIAIDFALVYPERCISLIPIGSWPNGYGLDEFSTHAADSMLSIYGKAAEMASNQGPKEATDYWWKGDHELNGMVTSKIVLDLLLKMGYEYSWWGFINQNKRTWASPLAIGSLSEIKLPCLIVTADQDIKACREVSDLMFNQIQGSKLVVIENADHVMNMEKPEEFNKIISEFIENDCL